MNYPVCSLYTEEGIVFVFETNLEEDLKTAFFYQFTSQDGQVFIRIGNFVIPSVEISIEQLTTLKNPKIFIGVKFKDSLQARIMYAINVDQNFLVELRAYEVVARNSASIQKVE